VNRGTSVAAVTCLYAHLSLIRELSHSCTSSAPGAFLLPDGRLLPPGSAARADAPKADRMPGPPSRQRLLNCYAG
jgi:hypothetical protein